MDSNDDKIKRLMSEDGLPLPPELEWEQMQDGIFKKMEELQSPPLPVRRSLWSRKNIILAGLTIIILFLMVLCNRMMVPPSQDGPAISQDQPAMGYAEWPGETEGKGAEATLPSAVEQEKNNTKEGLAYTGSSLPDEAPTGKPGSENTLQTEGLAGPNAQHQPTRPGPPAAQAPAEGKAQATLPDSSSRHPGMAHAETSASLPVSAALQKQEALDSPVSGEGEIYKLFPPVQALLTRRFFVEPTAGPASLPAVSQLASGKKAAPESTSKLSGRLSLLSSATWWNMGYGQTKPEREEYEHTITSYQAGFHYIHPLKKDFTLLFGLQVQQLENRFDWSTTIEDYTITLTDTIIKVQTNSLTGQQAEIRGDVELTVSAIRTVRHFNTTRLYQVPLAVGKTWIFNNWQADVLVGSALNIVTENKGRTFFEGELQDYNGATTGFFANQWKVHGMLMGHLTYRISNSVGITGGIQFQKSLSNWSTEEGVRMYPNVISGELGVQYSFR